MANWIEKIKQSHMLMMVLCCVVPLAGLAAAVYFFGLSKTYLVWFAALLCPIMHIFMMRDMHKEHKEDTDTSDKNQGVKAQDKKAKGGCH